MRNIRQTRAISSVHAGEFSSCSSATTCWHQPSALPPQLRLKVSTFLSSISCCCISHVVSVGFGLSASRLRFGVRGAIGPAEEYSQSLLLAGAPPHCSYVHPL